MAQITLGALTTLNLSTHLDPMFSELYPIWTAMTFASGKPIGMTLENAAYAPRFSCLYSGTFSWSFGGDAAGGTDFSIKFNTSECLKVSTSAVWAGSDNMFTLGKTSLRWSTIYAATGTINTSDAREKTAVSSLTTAEIAASKQLASELGSFRFLSAVAAKDCAARLHIGMTVQRAMAVMQSHGLDPLRYAFICHDQWVSAGDTPAGDRYGFRTDELLLFIARGFDARLAALEAT
jgi:hypothetical protein